MAPNLLSAAGQAPVIEVYVVEPEQLSATLENLQAGQWAQANNFTQNSSEPLIVPGEAGIAAVVQVLSESRQELQCGAELALKAPAGQYRLVATKPDEAAYALGFALACYRFSMQTTAQKPLAQLVLNDTVLMEELAPVVNGVYLARDLINTPANDLGPKELAAAAIKLFEQHNGHCEIISGEELQEGFPLVHAVGQGSDRAPRLIDATWGDKQHKTVTLVGKGVIFDSGGLDLKPAAGMLLMKKDMGGAANVLGLASMIMQAKLPIRLRVIIPAVENAVSGRSFRPSDVFTSRKGLTVEIGNTDAEGRLVLADALAYADEEKPELLIDMATLTGAARVALGPDLPPFYTSDEELAETVAVHSEAVNDPLWRMPLWAPYRSYITSKIADIANVNTSGAGFAGSMTAALFLQNFVEKAGSWMHFDIFGWTPIARDIKPQGGEAQGIRALFDMLKENSGTK
ncbi:leucyl aminopeptidase family protein [Polycladidibacter stylochi]|uniref:leucyl aminopeptidase family protein n=1 Tax=Polycladidibacter stylochi TaxID=1807766 RepID=UPI00082BD205|nr:leucyl aminopeptidase family protein [Pseudovibrio stylochi]